MKNITLLTVVLMLFNLGSFANCSYNSDEVLTNKYSKSKTLTAGVSGTDDCTNSVYLFPNTTGLVDQLFTAAPFLILPNCDATLTSPANGSTTASLNGQITWTAATGSPSGYKLNFGTTSGGTEIAAAVEVGSVLTYNVGTLLAGTTYYVTIIATNSSGDATGCTEYSFTTCASNTAFYENFDSVVTGLPTAMVDCWGRAGNGGVYVINQSVAPNTPPNRLFMSANGNAANPTASFVITPTISNLQAETHRLKFKAYATTANKSLEVGYLLDVSDLTTFVVLESISLPSTTQASTQEFNVEPSGIPLGVTNLVFRNNGPTGPTTIYIDDVSWEPIPACGDITTVKIQSFNSTSASLIWQASASESAWEYVYTAESVTDPTTLTPIAVNTTPSIALNVLTPATTYRIWVRSNCGNGALGSWPQNPIVFTTSCAGVTSFSENFDSYINTGVANPLPTCWSRIGNTGGSYITFSSAIPFTAPNRLLLSATAAGNGTSGIAVMPPVSNLSAGTHRLKFKAFSTTIDKSLELGYYLIAGDPESFVNITSFAMPSTTVAFATDFIYIPQSIPVGVESLVFKLNGSSFTGNTTVYIDDVIWEAIPQCFDITEITFTNIGATSADFQWNAGGSETAWEYVYAESTVTNPSLLTPIYVSGLSSASIANLSPTTSYNIWIRSVCGPEAFGNWSIVRTIVTACAPIAVLPWTESFEGIATVSSTAYPPCWFKQNGDWSSSNDVTRNTAKTGTKYIRNATNANNEFIWTPGFALTEGVSYDFSFFMQGDGFMGWNVSVFQNAMASSINAVQVGFTQTATGNGTAGIQAYQLVKNTFIPAETGVYNFAVRVNQEAISAYYVAFDDFKMELTPTCVSPTTEAATNVTSTSATISWFSDASPVNDYEYFVTNNTNLVPNATTIPTGVTSGGITLSNLTDLQTATIYKYYARSICNTNDKSPWSTAGTFTTVCAPISNLPWTEGFENVPLVNTNSFPPCWFKQNGDWQSSNATSFNTPRTGNNYIRDSNSAVNEFMWTPAFELTANTSYDFSFYMQGDGHTGWNVNVFQNTQQNSTTATPLGNTVTASGLGTTAPQVYELVTTTFVPTSTGVYYFAVRVNQNSGSSSYVAFDDFKVSLSPNCVAPVVNAVTNITTASATLNWSAPFTAPANGYAYYITSTLSDIPTESTIPTGTVAAGITSVELTTLTSATTYKVYVRSTCGITESSIWSQGGTFTTPCESSSLPYTIDFESATIPNLPLCTSNENIGTGNNWITINNPGSGFTNKTLTYEFTFTEAANTWFYSNFVNLVANQEYSISYKYGTNSTSLYTEKFKVAYGTSATSTAMINPLADHPGISGTTPQNNTVTFTPTVSGTYVFGFNAYSNANQNSLFLDNIVIQEVLGTADFNSDTFTAYPNPVKNNLNIRYTENIKDVTIFNLLGQQVLVKNINANEVQIDLSSLTSGTYLVKVKSGANVKTLKVIKE